VAEWHAKRQQQAAAAATPSGAAMPVGDIPGWHQIFTDDFTKIVPMGRFPGAVSNKWLAYPDGWSDTSKNGTYYPSKVVSEHDGVMDLYIHTENGMHLVSAPVPKLAAGSHDYGSGLSAGRYVVRFKADPIPCYKTAWLLWPDSEVWPGDGEIDFPEADLDGTISGFMHWRNGTSGNDEDEYDTNVTYTSWHTAVIEWRPDINDLKFYLDGKLVGHATSRVPKTPMHWVLQTETSVSGCIPSNSAAGHVLVDWVAVYVPSAHTAARTPTTSHR
jgi:beta-glucanase (GH16 family)